MDRRLSAYEERIGGVNQALEEKLGSNEERMERMRQTIEGGLEKISVENRHQLEQMRQTVDEKLNATVDQRLEASFSVVTKRLEQVTASLSAVQSLAGSIDELGRMVSGAKPLGVIGEAQLGAILSQMLAPSQYAEHAPVRPNGEPVADYVVVMPGQSGQNTVYLPIDASLPMREYHELCVAQENGTRADIESARGLLESAVRMHASVRSIPVRNPLPMSPPLCSGAHRKSSGRRRRSWIMRSSIRRPSPSAFPTSTACRRARRKSCSA